MLGVIAPKVPDKPPTLIGDATLAKLVRVRSGKSYDTVRDLALLRLGIDTGCRLGELTGLPQGDVDLKQGSAVVLGKDNKLRVVRFGTKMSVALLAYLRALKREQPNALCARPDHLSRRS